MSMTSRARKVIGDRRMIFVGVFLAVTYWILEALIDVLVFREGDVIRRFIPADPNELWMRAVACFLFIAFGMYANASRMKREAPEQDRWDPRRGIAQDVPAWKGRLGGGPMIYFGMAAALAFWFVEALTHTSVFHEGNFSQNLFPHDPNELWMRVVVGCLLLAIGFYAHASVSKLKKSEAERVKLQEELEKSLTRLLSGFIPICANCKDIRETNGDWIQIEGYIQNHSEVQFTHGICQKCMKALYPAFVAKA